MFTLQYMPKGQFVLMTQARHIIALLRGGPKTLPQIAAHPGHIFYEWRSRVSELRQQGYDIRHHKVMMCKACVSSDLLTDPRRCPAFVLGENCYQLHAEPLQVGAKGQMVLALG